MAYLPPTRSLNFLVHGSRARGLVPIPPHIEIVLFTEHDEALSSPQAALVFSWLRKNYEQGAANVLLQPVFIKTPQRRYRIGRQFEGPIIPFQSEEVAAAAAAAAAAPAPGVSPWSFRQGGGGGSSGGIGSLIVQPSAAGGGGGGGGAAQEPLLDTVQPSQPQQSPPNEFSVTLSVYSHTVGRNLCPNIVFSFEDEFQVNPAFPTSMLGIYTTETARLHYLGEGMPAAKSGRDLALTEQIFSRYGLGQFDLNGLLEFFPRGEGVEKTRIYLCCCAGSIQAPSAVGSVLHQGNIPGVPSSPLVNNVTNQGVRLKGVQKAIKNFKNAQATGNEEATRAARATLSQMIGAP
jgi:hypothetical protein